MNDRLYTANKLSHLLELAQSAETDFEKAAVFGATQAIQNMFRSDDELNGYAQEKVSKACWSIISIVGYDDGNHHSAEQHSVWALGSLQTLNNVLKDPEAV